MRRSTSAVAAILALGAAALCHGQEAKPCPAQWITVKSEGPLRLRCVSLPQKSRRVNARYETDLQIQVTDDLDRPIRGATARLSYQSTRGAAIAFGEVLDSKPDPDGKI